MSELHPQPHKVALLTGGNKGIGLAVLRKLLECEMTVVVAVRNPQDTRAIVEKGMADLNLQDRVFYEQCDVGDMNSVRELAERVKKRFSALNLLINNGKT
jgi:NAD(P)-dependent dehydrogenase (short-subunit alcohol dehydrogenase family)